MVKYRLTLPDNEVNESVPREMRAGHPVLQTQPRFDAQMNETIDQKSVRAGHRPTLQGVVPLGVTSGAEIAMDIPFGPSANIIDIKCTDGPQSRNCETSVLYDKSPDGSVSPNCETSADKTVRNDRDIRIRDSQLILETQGRLDESASSTIPHTVLDNYQQIDENMGEPFEANMGHTVESDNSVKNTPPSTGRPKLVEFLRLAAELRTRAKGQRESMKLRRNRDKRRLAQRGAEKRKTHMTNEGDGQPTLCSILRKGKKLYEKITFSAGREMPSENFVTSRPSPLPFTKRSMIGAAMHLQRQLKEGKELPSERPESGPSGNEEPTGSEPMDGERTVRKDLDEHLNLMTCYNVEMHNKLMQAEEHRTHMKSYIHFVFFFKEDGFLHYNKIMHGCRKSNPLLRS